MCLLHHRRCKDIVIVCEHRYTLQSARHVRTRVDAWTIYNDEVSKPRRRGVREYCRLESQFSMHRDCNPGNMNTYHKSSSGDEIPERDVTYHLLSLLIYHWTTTHLYFQNIFLSRPNDNCYISNGRRFTKSAWRILLLSTFRVSSINYSLASIVSRFIQEAQLTQRDREHTVSWNRIKCCTNARRMAFDNACNRWMTFKVIQGYCRCCHLIVYSSSSRTSSSNRTDRLTWHTLNTIASTTRYTNYRGKN